MLRERQFTSASGRISRPLAPGIFRSGPAAVTGIPLPAQILARPGQNRPLRSNGSGECGLTCQWRSADEVGVVKYFRDAIRKWEVGERLRFWRNYLFWASG